MEASAARGHPARSKPAPLTGRLLKLASDERLVAHVRHGSEPAFEAIFDRHHRGVLSFCRHMLGDAAEAEDAVQHTFMAAYRDLVGSEKPIQLKPWLYTIARNRCLSILRARREHPTDELDEVSTFNLAAEVQQRQDLQDLLRDLGGLPEDQRAALVLSELGDVSHDEIADVLGCQREKVKALVFQARSSLTASRKARETDCTEIREQLATLRGGALRRNTLRRHLKECPGCRAFADDVRNQRKMLAAVLPVVPTLGLKENALAAAFGGSGAAASASAGAAAGAAATGAAATGATASGGALAAKALLVVALAGGGGAVGVSAIGDADPGRPAVGQGNGPGGDVPAAPAAAGGQETAERARSGDTPIKRRVRKNKDGDKGRRGKAKGHGKGKARGQAVGHDPDFIRGGGRETKAQRDAQRRERAAARERRQAAQREQQQAKREAAAQKQPAKPVPEPKAEPTPAPTPAPTPTPVPDASTLEPESGDARGARGARP